MGDGPLPPDPLDGPPVGGHARELDDARLPRRRHELDPSRHARHGHHVSEHRPPREDRGHARRVVRRSSDVRNRRGVVPRGAPAYGWPFPAARRALRPARGRAPSAAAPVGTGHAVVQGTDDPGAGGDVLPTPAAGADPDPRRRLRRAPHAPPAARYADACNLFGEAATVARKVAVLQRHCAQVDRDPARSRSRSSRPTSSARQQWYRGVGRANSTGERNAVASPGR